MGNDKNFDIVTTFIQNKYAIFVSFLFTILVPIYSYFSQQSSNTLFLYILSLLIANLFFMFIMYSWLKNIGQMTRRLLMINDGRLHLLVSSSMVNLEYIEDSLEREEAFYRSYGFTVAILNEREEYSDVEFIINKPSEIDLDIDYDRVASGQTISETTNQIHIKINLSKGVFILPIKRIELSDSKVNSFRGSNRLLIFEIRSDSFRNIPKEKMCLIVQVVIKIT